MLRIAWLVVVCLVTAANVWGGPPGPTNLDFEALAGEHGAVPGWFVPKPCADGGWMAAVSEVRPADGARCVMLSRDGDGAGQSPFGNLMQSFDAAPYRGTRLVITLKVRLGDGGEKHGQGRVQPWVRVDRPNEQRGFFDNCTDRPVTDGEWKSVTFKADIDDDAVAVNLGMMVLGGDGPACLDSVALEVREKPVAHQEEAQPLTERGLHNLEAFTRVVGYIRHYHPSDEATTLDWDRFTTDAVSKAERAESADELAVILRAAFAPIAPTVAFQAKPFDKAFEPSSMLGAPDHPTGAVRWKHRGYGPNAKKEGAIYVSERITGPTDEKPEGLPAIGEFVTRECPIAAGESLWVRVPIVLYADANGTLPHSTSSYSPPAAEESSGDDRSTRLAAVVLGWNVAQHFFPYFEVIKDDWNAALPEALGAAATDADGDAFRLTLERMITHLHDGHGHVMARRPGTQFSLPMLLTFVGDDPVVLRAAGEMAGKNVHPGDVLVSVGGTRVAQLMAEARAHEPAASKGFFHRRAANRIAVRVSADPVDVVLRAPGGEARTVSLTPIPPHQIPPERGGPVISEPRPGIWYVDLDRASDKDLATAMPHLAEAKGIVLDMRGYPSGISMGFLGHFTEEPVQCAKWEIPLANWPDREHLEFDHARWEIPPLAPPITAKTAFITDGRAISAAETFLGIVEAYKLAEIVGEPTAGTNGNVNQVALPGGYSFIFTGMKVLKHDGSRHHGVGIIPTIPAHRTNDGVAAGKDEMLEKALDVVSDAR